MVVRLELRGIELHRLLEILLRGDEFAQTELAVAALQEKIGVPGKRGQSFGVGLDGLLVLAAAGLGEGEREVIGSAWRAAG